VYVDPNAECLNIPGIAENLAEDEQELKKKSQISQLVPGKQGLRSSFLPGDKKLSGSGASLISFQ
jgi:hypothetical protein